MHDRSGKRKTRDQLPKRHAPELGHYFIVTDTAETEKNYLYGLRDTIPKELQKKLVIKVSQAKTTELVNEALNMRSIQPQYAETWIVFDRDRVKNFDEIISTANKASINVGWSNPCIEIWFGAYFGSMPTYQDSVSCCKGFAKKYQRITKQEYTKADIAIYRKLCLHGNEQGAIKIAKQKYAEHEKNCRNQPSTMCPCTTLHTLVEKIIIKVQK